MRTLCQMISWHGKPQHACTGNFFGDQAFLNAFFPNYTRLPSHWNSVHKFHHKPIKVDVNENVHFTGSIKPPWHRCIHGTYTSKHEGVEQLRLLAPFADAVRAVRKPANASAPTYAHPHAGVGAGAKAR